MTIPLMGLVCAAGVAASGVILAVREHGRRMEALFQHHERELDLWSQQVCELREDCRNLTEELARREGVTVVSRPESTPPARPQRPFRVRTSQSAIAAGWEVRQSDAYKRRMAERQKQKEKTNGDDDQKR